MPKRHPLDDLLNSWAAWYERPVPELTYPSRTAEAKAKEPGKSENKFSGHLPKYRGADPEVKRLDLEIHELPEGYKAVIWSKHIAGLKRKQLNAMFRDPSDYYRRLARVRTYLAGRLGMEIC